jgi:hypothetical protein
MAILRTGIDYRMKRWCILLDQQTDVIVVLVGTVISTYWRLDPRTVTASLGEVA